MKTTIHPLEDGQRSVAVDFDHAGVRHSRTVNAVFKADGRYDVDGTAVRVEQVARGVEHKIALGVITNPPEATDDPA